jgi:hypothetical protein
MFMGPPPLNPFPKQGKRSSLNERMQEFAEAEMSGSVFHSYSDGMTRPAKNSPRGLNRTNFCERLRFVLCA